MILDDIKNAISDALYNAYGVRIPENEIILRPTPRGIVGDYSVNIRHLTNLIEKYGKEPHKYN